MTPVAVGSTRKHSMGWEMWSSVSRAFLLLNIPQPGQKALWAPCWGDPAELREGCSLVGPCKRTVNATLLMVEGNGALTMGLGNYCLT